MNGNLAKRISILINASAVIGKFWKDVAINNTRFGSIYVMASCMYGNYFNFLVLKNIKA
jgi:hypothetical protein